MKQITDLERHRVMIPHAKVSNWILWRKIVSQWSKKEWQEFEAVKAGEELNEQLKALSELDAVS